MVKKMESETVARPSLKAGPMDVIYKIRHNGVKVVICRYLDTYCYFFALKGEVYIDFVLPPNRKELRSHKTTLNEIEPKLISHLCSKAIENIEYHKKQRSWYSVITKKFNETRQRGISFVKSRFFNSFSNRRFLNVPSGRSEGSGNFEDHSAGQAAEASKV